MCDDMLSPATGNFPEDRSILGGGRGRIGDCHFLLDSYNSLSIGRPSRFSESTSRGENQKELVSLHHNRLHVNWLYGSQHFLWLCPQRDLTSIVYPFKGGDYEDKSAC